MTLALGIAVMAGWFALAILGAITAVALDDWARRR